MNTKEIKKFLRSTFGLSMLSVTSGLSKNPYLLARIKPSVYAPPVVGARDTYTEEFPLEFRQMALRVIYGEDCEFAARGNAGNVEPHNIAMHAFEWEKLVKAWDNKVQAEMVAAILAS